MNPVGNGVAGTALIDRTIQMRKEAQARKVMLVWGLLNVGLAGMVYMEMTGKLLCKFYNISYWPLWYIELVLVTLFCLNALFDFWCYFRSAVVPANLVMTPQQQTLLGMMNPGSDTDSTTAEAGYPIHTQELLTRHRTGTECTGSPFSPVQNMSLYGNNVGNAESSSLRARYRSAPSVYSAPLTRDECLTDMKSLENFLRSEEEKHGRSQL
eukprot:g40980.t1